MANVSRPFGARPVYHLQGARIQARKYFISSGDGTAVFKGDFVKLAGAADTDGTTPTVIRAAATNPVVGVVVGFMPNQSNLDMSGQYRLASTDRYCWVIDDPYVVFEMQGDASFVAADVGLNCEFVATAGSTTTGESAMVADHTNMDSTATRSLKVLGLSPRVDNEIGTSDKILVLINNHQLRGTGILGV